MNIVKPAPVELVPDHSPETIDELIWIPYQGDRGINQKWYGHGVEDGEIISLDCDEDGNWDTDGCGEPATEENFNAAQAKLWKQHDDAVAWYDQHCLETGEDPLYAYYVKRTTKTNENYIVYANPWIGASEHGMVVTSIRGAKTHLQGKTLADPSAANEHLRGFLGLEKVGDRYCMKGIKTREDIMQGDNVGCVGDYDANGGIYIKLQIERESPRPESKVKADIRRIAKQSIERRIAAKK